MGIARVRPAPSPARTPARQPRVWATAACLLLLGGCSLIAPPERTEPPDAIARLPAPPPPAPAAPARPRAPEVAVAPAPAPLPDVAPTPPPPGPAVSTRHYQLGAASGALVAQAHAASAKSDYLTALSTLERAVRIEPRNPLVWIEIAKIRLASGEAAQAESTARKAVALSEGDQRTSAEAWRQVALALKAQNRNPEAAAAEARANRPYVDGAEGR